MQESRVEEETRLRQEAEETEEAERREKEKAGKRKPLTDAELKRAREEREKSKRFVERGQEGFERMKRKEEKEREEATFSAESMRQAGIDFIKKAATLTLFGALGQYPQFDVRASDTEAAQDRGWTQDKEETAQMARAAHEAGDYEMATETVEVPAETLDLEALRTKVREEVAKLNFDQLKKIAKIIGPEAVKKLENIPKNLSRSKRKLEAVLAVRFELQPRMSIMEDTKIMLAVAEELGLEVPKQESGTRSQKRAVVRSARRGRQILEAAAQVRANANINRMKKSWSWEHVSYLVDSGEEVAPDAREKSAEKVIKVLKENGFGPVEALQDPGAPNVYMFHYKNKEGNFAILPDGIIEYEFHDLLLPVHMKKGKYAVEMFDRVAGKFTAGSLKESVKLLKSALDLKPEQREAMLQHGPQHIYGIWPFGVDPRSAPEDYLYYLVAAPLEIPDDALGGKYGIRQLGSPYPITANFPMLWEGTESAGAGRFGYRKVFRDVTRYQGAYAPYHTAEEWLAIRREEEAKRDKHR